MHAQTKQPTLAESYARLKTERPQLRVREAAKELGVSEAEVVEAEGAQRLRPDWAALLERMPALGRVMCLTRNEVCVHERHGCYEKVEIHGGMGLVLGPDIDLRLFLRRWASGFACPQNLHSGTRQSLQFFDAAGVAIQKIYLTDDSDAQAYAELLKTFVEPDAPPLAIQASPARPADKPDVEIDAAALKRDWEGLRDTHDFYGLLNKHKVSRTQALRLAGAPLAVKMNPGITAEMLGTVSANDEPIMAFVGNPGCIQIHTGRAKKIAAKNGWLNVLDEQFNLHLREALVAQTWLVRKPTEDGVVTALELFDKDGELVVQFFGKRKPGVPERQSWRELLGRLATEFNAHA
ncbi:MAG: ChuX/HutX family heme-like substrate-binding protein [Pseudomonadota bacterium]